MPLSTSFVRTGGMHFELEGKPRRLTGANNYYLATAPDAMIEPVLTLAKEMELNVLRTSAFLDCGAAEPTSTLAEAKGGVFFHYWNSSSSKPGFDDGPNGLEHLDQAIAMAEKFGLRLILPFANYWPDFGGIDQHLKWFGLTGRDQLYSNSQVNRYIRITWSTYSHE